LTSSDDDVTSTDVINDDDATDDSDDEAVFPTQLPVSVTSQDGVGLGEMTSSDN